MLAMMVRSGVACVLFALRAAALTAQTPADVRLARELVERAGAAYRENDLEQTLELLEQALRLRPAHSVMLYNAAHVAARIGRTDSALEYLADAAALGLLIDLEADTALTRLSGDPRFASIGERLVLNSMRVGTSEVAFSIDESAFLPEGIAYDRVTRSFLVGSVHQRRIVAIDSTGAVRDFASATSGATTRDRSLYGVLGMAVDAARRRVWVTTAAVPQVRAVTEADLGYTAVHVYDADTGDLERVYAVPDDSGTHHFGDIAIDTVSGDAFISDASGAIHRIPDGAPAVSALVLPGQLDSPQGLVVFSEEQKLIVADYSTGLWQVDLRTGAALQLHADRPLHLMGLDGLARHGRDLIAIQNYPEPHRVLRITLSAELDHIASCDVLESRHEAFSEPTLGVVVDDAFYYIANSQWLLFAPGSEAERAKAAPPIVLRARLR